VLEGAPGILRIMRGTAAVREREGARQIQEVTHSPSMQNWAASGRSASYCSRSLLRSVD